MVLEAAEIERRGWFLGSGKEIEREKRRMKVKGETEEEGSYRWWGKHHDGGGGLGLSLLVPGGSLVVSDGRPPRLRICRYSEINPTGDGHSRRRTHRPSPLAHLSPLSYLTPAQSHSHLPPPSLSFHDAGGKPVSPPSLLRKLKPSLTKKGGTRWRDHKAEREAADDRYCLSLTTT